METVEGLVLRKVKHEGVITYELFARGLKSDQGETCKILPLDPVTYLVESSQQRPKSIIFDTFHYCSKWSRALYFSLLSCYLFDLSRMRLTTYRGNGVRVDGREDMCRLRGRRWGRHVLVVVRS